MRDIWLHGIREVFLEGIPKYWFCSYFCVCPQLKRLFMILEVF